MKWESWPGRDHPVLATWPELWLDRWMVYEYALHPERGLHWRKRVIPTESGHVRADVYGTFDEAEAAAIELNTKFLAALPSYGFEGSILRSMELKATKAVQCKSRLANEERLMLAESIRRSKSAPRLRAEDLELAPKSEPFRQELADQLFEMPYLKMVLVGEGSRRYILRRKAESKWSEPRGLTQRNCEIAVRARIANGFGFEAEEHGGKPKRPYAHSCCPEQISYCNWLAFKECWLRR